MVNAYLLIKDLFHGWSLGEIRKEYLNLTKMGLNWVQIVAGIVSTGVLIVWDMASEKKEMFERIRQKPVFIRWSFYYIIVLSIILFSAPENRQFIYLQF
jgi:hypothetical protein